jgi:hypothetical protein
LVLCGPTQRNEHIQIACIFDVTDEPAIVEFFFTKKENQSFGANTNFHGIGCLPLGPSSGEVKFINWKLKGHVLVSDCLKRK